MNQSDITYQEKLDELRLDVSHPNNLGKSFILVEGDHDIRLFRKLFNLQSCKVESIPGGKLKLEECVDELNRIYILVIGIRDADFIHLDKTNSYAKLNMFLTDYHDIEICMLSDDEVFSSIMFEYTDFSVDLHKSKKLEIFKSIEEISLLKFLNDKEDLRIEFSAGFVDLLFVNSDQENILKEYYRRSLRKSPNARIKDFDTIDSKIKALKEQGYDFLQLTNGHDLIKALAEYLRKKGTGAGISADSISSSVRIKYTDIQFSMTELYKTTKQWADSNNCVIYR